MSEQQRASHLVVCFKYSHPCDRVDIMVCSLYMRFPSLLCLGAPYGGVMPPSCIYFVSHKNSRPLGMLQTALAPPSLHLPRMSKRDAPPPFLARCTGPGLRSRRCRRPGFLLFSSFMIFRSWCSLEPHAVIPMGTLGARPRPFSNPPFQG